MLRRWQVAGTTLSNAEGTLVMGVLNVTPDSFSDGGRYLDPARAVSHGLRLWEEGADLVDVGGESTRPGSGGVDEEEELRRVLPVVRGLVADGVTVSVDTSKPLVAAACLEAGAAVINDVTALGSEEMAGVVAEAGAGVVLMHMQGTPDTMQVDPRYDDVVAEVTEFLVERAGRAEEGGIDRARICLDPGIGFGKTLDHNLALLAHLDALAEAGYPVLVGTSRKSFIGHLLGGLPPEEREDGTAATLALAVAKGATAVRVHDVLRAVRALRVADAVVRAAGDRAGTWAD